MDINIDINIIISIIVALISMTINIIATSIKHKKNINEIMSNKNIYLSSFVAYLVTFISINLV
jgi:hypothetical protein